MKLLSWKPWYPIYVIGFTIEATIIGYGIKITVFSQNDSILGLAVIGFGAIMLLLVSNSFKKRLNRERKKKEIEN